MSPGAADLSLKDQNILEKLIEAATGAKDFLPSEHSLNSEQDQTFSSLLSHEDTTTSWVVSEHSLQNIHVKYVPEHIHRKEQSAIHAAENDGNFAVSLKIFDNILTQYPGYASGYNNRAQLKRLMVKAQNEPNKRLYVDIIKDLQTCIELARPSPDTPNSVLSSFQRTLLRNAHTQLGLTFLEMREEFGDDVIRVDKKDWDLEARAQRHLNFAGMYGNEMAGKLAVLTNKYAQMCGDIVMQSLIREFCLQNTS